MYYRPRGARRSSYKDYFVPFLIIVCIGVILVLIFNLLRALFSADSVKAAYLHVDSGTVQMKAWGTEGFFDINSDVLVMQGDEIYTAAGSKVIVEFFDGTILRLDGGTDVIFDSISDESDDPEISLKLLDGAIWVNKVYKNTQSTVLNIDLTSVVVRSEMASVFEVENEVVDAVRVFNVFENEGLGVDVMSKDGGKVLDSENVGVGQEVLFTKEVMERYYAFQSPTVVTGVGDEFKTTPWYLWNVAEDKAPKQFEKVAGASGAGLVKVEPEILVPEDSGDDVVVEPTKPEETDKTEEDKTETVATGALSKPTVTSVAGKAAPEASGTYKVTSRVATLTGNVSGADKVVVNGYILQKFKPGDTTWTYFANSDFGLMKAGDNTYEIYSIDASGKKSETLTLKIFYEPAVAAPVAEPVKEEPKTEDDAAKPVEGGDAAGTEGGAVVE